MFIKRAIFKLQNLPNLISAQYWLLRHSEFSRSSPNLPYQCQFPDPKRVADYIEEDFSARDDNYKQSFGFKTDDEVDYWTHRGCGIACVKMLIEAKGEVSPTFASLTLDGKALGGYDTATDRGWYYQPLVKLLAKYSIVSQTRSYLPLVELTHKIATHNLAIVSVNPQIIRKDRKITSREKSGHLVLVTGVEISNRKINGFYINNPSGKTPDTQHNSFVPTSIFSQAYGSRGILVSNPQSKSS